MFSHIVKTAYNTCNRFQTFLQMCKNYLFKRLKNVCMLLDLGNEDTWTSLSPGGLQSDFYLPSTRLLWGGRGGILLERKKHYFTNTFDIFKILVNKQLEWKAVYCQKVWRDSLTWNPTILRFSQPCLISWDFFESNGRPDLQQWDHHHYDSDPHLFVIIICDMYNHQLVC